MSVFLDRACHSIYNGGNPKYKEPQSALLSFSSPSCSAQSNHHKNLPPKKQIFPVPPSPKNQKPHAQKRSPKKFLPEKNKRKWSDSPQRSHHPSSHSTSPPHPPSPAPEQAAQHQASTSPLLLLQLRLLRMIVPTMPIPTPREQGNTPPRTPHHPGEACTGSRRMRRRRTENKSRPCLKLIRLRSDGTVEEGDLGMGMTMTTRMSIPTRIVTSITTIT
ncbi:hypothetical protein DFH27DRAFT_572959 [Peziza echinospora]|nr:hypothetical protein DFH27DRAFT_572959 [Peziza echinospora]